MQTVTRRDFISNTSIAMAGMAFAGSADLLNKKNQRLSFTTLGCPDWDLPKITDFAAKNGYDAIEIRGILRELDLTKCPDFSSNKISSTIRMVKDRGLKFVGLGTSAHLHDSDKEKRKTNMDEAKKFIDLAHKLNCPYVRVFPDTVPNGQERDQTSDLISKGLLDLANYAGGSRVSILLEPNGDFVKTDDLNAIMKNAAHPQVGILWNVSMMWSATKESPASVYNKLKKYVRHTHIKDLKLINGEINGAESYNVLLGQGDVPVSEAVKSLYKGNYSGSYCCEWEKYWYPGIREPEVALAHFSKEIKKYFKEG